MQRFTRIGGRARARPPVTRERAASIHTRSAVWAHHTRVYLIIHHESEQRAHSLDTL